MKRIHRYTKEIIYVGDLDTLKLSSGLNNVFNEFPKYLIRLEGNVNSYEVDNKIILLINIVSYIPGNILEDSEVIETYDLLNDELNNYLKTELTEQGVLYDIL